MAARGSIERLIHDDVATLSASLLSMALALAFLAMAARLVVPAMATAWLLQRIVAPLRGGIEESIRRVLARRQPRRRARRPAWSTGARLRTGGGVGAV